MLTIADFRRDRGNAKRVIMFAGKRDVVQKALDTALSLKDRLLFNDFILVPVVLAPAAGGVSATELAAQQVHRRSHSPS